MSDRLYSAIAPISPNAVHHEFEDEHGRVWIVLRYVKGRKDRPGKDGRWIGRGLLVAPKLADGSFGAIRFMSNEGT